MAVNKLTYPSKDNAIQEKINEIIDELSVIPPIAYGTSTTAAATVQKEVSIPEITELRTGQVIVVQPTITSTVANSTIKLNDFDPYPMRYNNAAITTSTDSVVWSANFPSTFVFDGEYWVFTAHGLDSNTTYTLNYSIDAGAYKSGTGSYAITRYSLCMQKPDMTWEKVTATNANYSTGTTKSVNTSGFLLGNIRYYSTTATKANGAYTDTNVMYEKAAKLDLRYSTNCGDTPSWTAGDYIYFVGTMGVDGLFYLDTTTWWTNTLPSTNDGKLYVQLGKFLSESSISLYENHPAYYYDGTKLCEYKIANNKQDTLISGTNIKTINNTSILGSGNIDIQGGGTVDQTFDGTSANAQSGVAIYGALTDGSISPTFGDSIDISSANLYFDSDNYVLYSSAKTDFPEISINSNYDFKTEINAETGENELLIYSNITDDNIWFSSEGGILIDTSSSGGQFTYNGNEIATLNDIPSLTNYVTTNTDQNITGVKTFVGQKRIGFKQSGTSDKLGFTLYNSSNVEKGYLEFNPSNTVDSVPLMTLGNYATSAASLTHVGFRKYSSISGASGAYNLLAPLISDAKTPFSLTTTYTNFYLPLGFTNGNTTVLTAKSGLVNISSLLPTVPTNISAFTNDSGYITSNALSGYATETWVGQQGYITGITSSDVTTALGFTPYDSNNPNGFISGITSSDVTTALGYTPYNSSNPNGYTSNIGTVTSVNNIQPDANGNVTISSGSSTDVQINGTSITSSGVANILTNSAYSSSNKIATMSDLPASDVFIAEYGVTTQNELYTAYISGKVIICPYYITSVSGNYYQIHYLDRKDDGGGWSFTHTRGKQTSRLTLTNGGTWQQQLIYNLEETSNKVTSISSSSTDTQYPSAKCVYDELADKADTDLSNLSSTGQKVIDGQWVISQSILVSSDIELAINTGRTFDLSSYLPNDNYNYEVLVAAVAQSTSTSGSTLNVSVYSDLITNTDDVKICVGRTRANNTIICGGNTIIPIGTGRTIGLHQANISGTASAHVATITNFRAMAYRRIGTNS